MKDQELKEKPKMNKPLVSKYGSLWARNRENIGKLRREGKLFGVYVLCDGSMPVYIGRGKLTRRITGHMRSKSRGQFWDHFSWFALADRKFEADVEALLLRMLPFYLRSLNKLRNNFADACKISQSNPVAESIKRPYFVAKRKRK